MRQKDIVQGDLLYHAVHGLCRVDEVESENRAGKEVPRYSLVPKTANKMKVRFVVSAIDLGISGFHAPVSSKAANEILDYLKAGTLTAIPEEEQAWGLAKAILSSSHDRPEFKDARKRQMLERSAKGLVGELAFVLKMTLKEMSVSIQKSLGNASQISPMVLTALAHAGED